MDAHPEIRTARPDDFARIAAVIDDWWGRPMQSAVPRLFLDHFHPTSLAADIADTGNRGDGGGGGDGGDGGDGGGGGGGGDGRDGLAGFLIGFPSPAQPDAAYIHFVGISPDHRRTGLGARFYERFFAIAREAGRSRVRAITSPVNTRSAAFHRAMGFTESGPIADYDGPGADRLLFERTL
ncbi:ribosomal protein S18 acetylase RimI-like enzyme [Murinocardiopsis flavida]|uniref:Ribosomal protein S18 acetylase RimI-like enzyme n=1 Tax=Murinocardiopsis flavida TaxID=645275 RepID=A0A2P8CUX0_9ACTN|nr:GNAT family N-acetyltransferase [Murinocardiopsis flavida]PSK88757.1 ribosomal protein S18 acetylase RimI-like enzyme [Murinocardiopsis flavida]